MMKTMEYNITTADGETHKGGITIKRGHSFTNVKIINNIKEIVGQEFIDVFDVDNQCEIKKCYGKDITTNNFMVIVKEDDGKLKAGMFLLSENLNSVLHIKRVTKKFAIYDKWDYKKYTDVDGEPGWGMVQKSWGVKKQPETHNNNGETIFEPRTKNSIYGIRYFNIKFHRNDRYGDDIETSFNKMVNHIKKHYEKPVIRLEPPRVEDNYMFSA